MNADSSIDLEEAILAMRVACGVDRRLTFLMGDVGGDGLISFKESIYVTEMWRILGSDTFFVLEKT